MVFQILLNHFFSHLTNCGTKITSRPKMLSPITLFQMWKLFKQVTGCSSFDSPHDFTGRNIRWRTHQNMDMILAHNTTDYPNLKRLTSLPD